MFVAGDADQRSTIYQPRDLVVTYSEGLVLPHRHTAQHPATELCENPATKK
jgi:hypothetical protein